MNFIKYFKDTEYIEGKNDCWTFVQKVFKDEYNFILPEHPILIDKKDIATALISNIPYKIIKTPEKGCIIYYHNGTTHHAGYAINNKEFIHKTINGVRIDKIPVKSTIYKVLND